MSSKRRKKLVWKTVSYNQKSRFKLKIEKITRCIMKERHNKIKNSINKNQNLNKNNLII